MITLNDAEKIVNEVRRNTFDSYEEFTDLYLFYDNQELLTDGGWNAPVVVEKANGRLWGLNSFAVKFPMLLDEKKFVCGGAM